MKQRFSEDEHKEEKKTAKEEEEEEEEETPADAVEKAVGGAWP